MNTRLSTIFIAALSLAIAGCNTGNSAGGPTPTSAPPSSTPPQRATTIFVATATVPGRILTVGATAAGTVKPRTLIAGRKPGLAFSFFAFVDGFGRIWTTNCLSLGGDTSGPLAFPNSGTGDIPPKVAIVGSNTGLSDCQTGIAIDLAGNVYVADITNAPPDYPGGQVAGFQSGQTGNVAPALRIAGTNANFHSPTGLALDASLNIYVADSCQGYSCPGDVQVFAAGSTGNVASMRTISGNATGILAPEGLAFDASGNLYVANAGNGSITVYSPGATGNAAPIRTIRGSTTKLRAPCGIAVDAKGYLYVGNELSSSSGTENYPILVFAPGAAGDVAPVQTITIDTPRMSEPAGIAVK